MCSQKNVTADVDSDAAQDTVPEKKFHGLNPNFFKFLRTGTQRSGGNESLPSHDCGWSDFVRKVPDNVEMLVRHKCVKKFFLRTNTALPSSAAIERMFSIAGNIFTSKRARMTWEHFEERLFARFLCTLTT